MTKENKKQNVKEELARAEECLESAELLASHGHVADAISRLYYYVYHAVRALLLSKGLEPKTHDGVVRLLGMHFVKDGILESGLSHVFTKLMKYREEADYNPSYVFTKDDFTNFKQEAVSLHSKVVQVLRSEGLL